MKKQKQLSFTNNSNNNNNTNDFFWNVAREHGRIYYMLLGGSEHKYDNETTRRVAQFGEELYRKRNYEKFTTFESKNQSMIVAHDLKLFSFCEHHLLPFFGIVNIGYLPFGQVFGLSKLQRIVDKFASKPNIQENLTEDIAEFLMKEVNTPHCIVQLKAIHTCVIARGTESTNAQFTTTSINGNFKEATVRNEFFQTLISNDKLRIF